MSQLNNQPAPQNRKLSTDELLREFIAELTSSQGIAAHHNLSEYLVVSPTSAYRAKSHIFERNYVTNVLGLDIPLNESFPYSSSFEMRIIQEQIMLEGFFSDILQKGKDALISAKDGIKQFGKDAWDILKGFYLAVKEGGAAQLGAHIASDAMKKYVKPIRRALEFLVKKLPEWGMDKLGKLAQKAKDILMGLIKKVKGLKGWKAVAAFSGLAVAVTWVWDKIGDFIEELEGMVGGWAAGLKITESKTAASLKKIKEYITDSLKDALSSLLGDELMSIFKSIATAPGVGAWWEAAQKVAGGAALVMDAVGDGTSKYVKKYDAGDYDKKEKKDDDKKNESYLRAYVGELIKSGAI